MVSVNPFDFDETVSNFSDDTESLHSFDSVTEKDFNKNIEYELYLEKCYNETSIYDKELYIFDYDDTLRLHTIREQERQLYESKLFNFLTNLKQKNKKIYLVSYNIRPFQSCFTKSFNERFQAFFDGLVYPQPIHYTQFKGTKHSYTSVGSNYYIYNPKHLDILDIAKKHDVPKDKIVFFDDNIEQIKLAKEAGIPSIHVSIKFGIPLP